MFLSSTCLIFLFFLEIKNFPFLSDFLQNVFIIVSQRNNPQPKPREREKSNPKNNTIKASENRICSSFPQDLNIALLNQPPLPPF